MDVNDLEQHEPLIQGATEALDGLDGVLIAHGTLPDQKAVEASYVVAERELKTNFLSVVSLLTPLANQLEAQRGGFIAGDFVCRGRQRAGEQLPLRRG